MIHTLNLNRKHLRAAALFAAKNDIRHYLGGVFIEAQERTIWAVATNGKILLACREDRAPDEPDNSPTSFIIPCELVEGIKAAILEIVTITYDDATSWVTVTDAAKGMARSAPCPSGEFPDWRRVLPHSPSGKTVQFAPDLISVLGRANTILQDCKIVPNPWLHHNGHEQALVTFPNHPNVLGVVCPLRYTDADRPEIDIAAFVRAAPAPGAKPVN